MEYYYDLLLPLRPPMSLVLLSVLLLSFNILTRIVLLIQCEKFGTIVYTLYLPLYCTTG